MTVGERVRERRARLALTQEELAKLVGVSRELVALWESGERIPGARRLDELGLALQVSPMYLVGEEELPEEHDWAVLFRGSSVEAEVAMAVRRWLSFLDDWASFLEDDLAIALPGPGRPPRRLAETGFVQDARRAPSLAEKVREEYRLGRDAVSDLPSFLDENGVLVVRLPVGDAGREAGGVSGAFFNHARLGCCVLVNSSTTAGRQAFTLAHEFAHALFHHSAGGILCRSGDADSLERFADAFAAHFLVPGKDLRRLVKAEHMGEDLEPYQVLALAAYFHVSYAMMLVRLRQERLLTDDAFHDYRKISPSSLARQLGINPGAFSPPDRHEGGLDRYPVSVLARAAGAIQGDLLTPGQAAELLGVDSDLVQSALLGAFPDATDAERREFDELPA